VSRTIIYSIDFVVNIDSRGRITLPIAIRKKWGVQNGETIRIFEDAVMRKLIIAPVDLSS
jgi:bifunctional DNA-binding transcriptional regulator/antitoxin component of YhaV-PrlF toxin-antitoxin module